MESLTGDKGGRQKVINEPSPLDTGQGQRTTTWSVMPITVYEGHNQVYPLMFNSRDTM